VVQVVAAWKLTLALAVDGIDSVLSVEKGSATHHPREYD